MALDKQFKDIPGTIDLRRRAIAQRLLAQPVLHVADEGGEPRALQGRRARLSRRLEDDRGAEAGGAGPRPQPHDGARRQHLFPAKIGATDGKSFQQMAGSMTGMSEEEYRDMMIKGGRSIEGNRSRRGRRRAAQDSCRSRPDKDSDMARITARLHLAHPRRRRGLRSRQDRRALLEAGVRRLRLLQAMGEGRTSPT